MNYLKTLFKMVVLSSLIVISACSSNPLIESNQIDEVVDIRESVEDKVLEVPEQLLTTCNWLPDFIGTTREDLIQHTIKISDIHNECYVLNKAKLEYLINLRKQQ